MKFASLLSVVSVALVGSVLIMPTEADFFRSLLASTTCSWTCDTQCATCTATAPVDATTKTVTINVGGCKGDKISWMCCKDTPGCTLSSCNGSAAASGSKCDEVTSSTFSVPVGTTTMKLQIHDGQLAGNVDCSGSGACCGGDGTSCGTLSGVCNIEVDLSTCPTTTPPQCVTDADCGAADATTCTKPVCNAGTCSNAPLAAGNVCRAATDLCDAPEVCDGTTMACPSDAVAPVNQVCRVATGLCDVPEVCDGSSKACPTDSVAALNQVCRVASDLCDVPEVCDGSSKDCPTDAVAPVDTVCRVASGLCDVPEVCDGSRKACPTDAVAPVDTVCRLASDLCDAPEKCDGSTKNCPTDLLAPKGTVCRPVSNPCDVPETCDGTHPACPLDLENDEGKVFKCGRTCYLCGIAEAKLVLGSKSAYSLGSCGIGACDSFVTLPWPSCVNECVSKLCPNNRELSNIGHYTCDHSNGDWVCKNKQEGVFPGSVCPSYTR